MDVDVVTVRVDVDDTGFGLNEPFAPVGRPLTLRPAAPLNPPDGVSVTAYDVPCPAVTVLLEGLAESEKSGVGVVPQPLTLNEPMRVCQLQVPLVVRYSLV